MRIVTDVAITLRDRSVDMLIGELGAVVTLMIVFPFSKLLHVPGVFFAPSRTQVDNAREHRHLAPWAAHMDGEREA